MAYKMLLFFLHFHFPQEIIKEDTKYKIQFARFFGFFLVRGTNRLEDYKNSPSLKKNVDFLAVLEVIINNHKNTYSSISRGTRQFHISATVNDYCIFPFFKKTILQQSL